MTHHTILTIAFSLTIFSQIDAMYRQQSVNYQESTYPNTSYSYPYYDVATIPGVPSIKERRLALEQQKIDMETEKLNIEYERIQLAKASMCMILLRSTNGQLINTTPKTQRNAQKFLEQWSEGLLSENS
jgi:hypothetical protein